MIPRPWIALALSLAVLGAAPQPGQAQQGDPLSRESVLRDPAAPVIGNVDAEFTIVEFFDYQCPYCKQIRPVVEQVVKEDGKIRLVLKDWPIFGDTSRDWSKYL